MYNFIFRSSYSKRIKQGCSEKLCKIIACTRVIFIISLHFILLLGTIKIKLIHFGVISKALATKYFLPVCYSFLFLSSIITFFYYSKNKIDKLMFNHIDKDSDIVYVLFLYIMIPIILSIILLNI